MRTATGGSQRGPTSSCADPAQRAARAATAAVPLAFLALFFAWPLVAILRRSLVVDGSLDLPFDVLTASSTREIAWFTFWQATVSTVLTLLAGLPLAWALARFSFRGRSLVEALVLVPFVLPTIVVATAFLALLPDGVERSVWAILIAHVFFNVAVVVRVVGAFWSGLDERLWDAAATLGAGPDAAAPAADGAAARAGAGVGRVDRVPLLLHLVRRDRRPRRNPLLDARDGDLQPGGALLRPAHGRGARPPSARRGRRGRDRLRGARAASRRRATSRAAGPEAAPAAAGSRSTGSSSASVALLLLPPIALVLRSLRVGDGYGLDHFASLFDETPALLVTPWHAVALLASLRDGGRRDRARRRGPRRVRGGEGDARRRRAADAAARRLRRDAGVRLPARVRRPSARPPLVRRDRAARPGARRDAVRRPLARPRAPRP